jgi:hypothetical protein
MVAVLVGGVVVMAVMMAAVMELLIQSNDAFEFSRVSSVPTLTLSTSPSYIQTLPKQERRNFSMPTLLISTTPISTSPLPLPPSHLLDMLYTTHKHPIDREKRRNVERVDHRSRRICCKAAMMPLRTNSESRPHVFDETPPRDPDLEIVGVPD